MPVAMFRKSPLHEDFHKMAEDQLKQDLTSEDREVLRKGASRVSWHTTVGSLTGLGLGIYMAFRLRRVRLEMFNAFRAHEKPVQVMFEGGRAEQIPDITAMMRPTRIGDYATHFFFGLGGLFIGGETGFLFGSWLASRGIAKDEDRKQRIETAYRHFRSRALRAEAARLEAGGSVWDA